MFVMSVGTGVHGVVDYHFPYILESQVRSRAHPVCVGERSGSVVECLTRDRGAAGSSLTGITALLSLSKTHLS